MYIEDVKQRMNEQRDLMDQLARDNFRLRSEPNLSFAEAPANSYRNITTENKHELKSYDGHTKRYNLRTPTREPLDNMRHLYPETDLAIDSEPSFSPLQRHTHRPKAADGYQRLRNKQWVDSLYEDGKQKQLARSKSAFLTQKEAEELKECTFHPRIKHNFLISNDYHDSTSKLIEKLSKEPTKEKAKLDKIKREFREKRECTFSPKLVANRTARSSRSRSVFDELYQEK